MDYAQRILAKLLASAETDGYWNEKLDGTVSIEVDYVQLDEHELAWLDEFRNRVVSKIL